MTVHLTKHYAGGIGHVEARDGRFLVSFYGRRVSQAWAESLGEARKALRAMAGAR